MFHEIKIIGNLGKEPELKFTPDGKAVCTFSVAASNKKDETRGNHLHFRELYRKQKQGAK